MTVTTRILCTGVAAAAWALSLALHAADEGDANWQPLPLGDPSFEKIAPGPVAGPDWHIPKGPYGPAAWGSISESQAHSGTRSLRIDDKDRRGFFVRCKAFKALPRAKYRSSVWVFNECGVSRMYLEFFDKHGARIAHSIKQGNSKGKWEQLKLDAKAPWQVATVDVGLYSLGGNIGVSFYDDVALEVSAPPKLAHPGFPEPKGRTAMNIDSTLQLFTDGRLIDKMTHVQFKLHPPTPGEIALHMSKPWEGVTSCYPSVIKDGDRYRLWYRVSSEGQPKNWNMTAYAESADGVRWTRPSLGLIEFQGSKDNNIVWPTPGHSGHNLCVFLDGNPAAPESERYKAIMHGPVLKDRRATISGLASPDGIHWRLAQPEPLLAAPKEDPAFDSHNQCFWDAAQQRYVLYARGWRGGVRGIRMATSKDFKTWSRLRYIDMGETPAEHLYTSACHPYFRQPHLYIALPSRFMPTRRLNPKWPRPGMSDVVVMTSHDGLHFDRTFMEAFIRPGLDPNNWTDRALYPGPNVVPIGEGDPPKEMSFYYFENYRHRTNRLRRAVIRVDGFASIHAGYPKGEFVTKPIRFIGKHLILNYATSGAGSVRIEIQNAEGKAIPAFCLEASDELYGDELAKEYRWVAAPDLSECSGKPVRLRIILQDADIFSLRFAD